MLKVKTLAMSLYAAGFRRCTSRMHKRRLFMLCIVFVGIYSVKGGAKRVTKQDIAEYV